MAKFNITTSISEEHRNLVLRNGWKWSEIFKAGIGAMMKPEVLSNELQAKDKLIDHLLERIRNKEKSEATRRSIKQIMGWRE